MAQVLRTPICVETRDGEGRLASRAKVRTHQSLTWMQAIEELRTTLGEDAISTDDEDLHRHGYSEWSSINIDQLPVAVAYPKSTEECASIAKVCYKYKIPMSMFTRIDEEMGVDSVQFPILEDQALRPTSRLRLAE